MVLRYSDQKSYDLIQQKEGSEMQLAVLFSESYRNKRMEVHVSPNALMITADKKQVWKRQFRQGHVIKPDETTWVTERAEKFVAGDHVMLKALSKKELNGLVAIVLKPTEETIEKGRIRCMTQDKKSLSIKPENLDNLDKMRKVAILITLEKAGEVKPWAFPPWDDNDLTAQADEPSASETEEESVGSLKEQGGAISEE
jgi:hypothetical protein